MVEGFELTGKRALVVGDDGGVARAIAEALTAAGATVYRAGTRPHGPLTGEDTVREGLAQLGGLDVVVSCLGRPLGARFEELSEAVWDRLIEENLSAPIRLIRAAGRHMLGQGAGRIIQVVSLVGERGVPNTAAYAACQAGLIQLVNVLALEWAREHVRINAIGLGWMEGDPLVSSPHPSPLPEGEGAVVSADERLLRYLPTRRLGRADEVGAVAVYLASDAADMMTGQVLWVDGAILSHA